MTAPESTVDVAARPPRFDAFPAKQGIGGLLLLFTIGQCLAVLMNLAQLPSLGEGIVDGGWALGESVRFYRPIVAFEAVAHLLLLVGGLAGLWLLFRKDPRTPSFYVAFLAFMALYGAVELVGVQVLYPQFRALAEAAGQPLDDLAASEAEATSTGLRMVLAGLLWLLYWRGSTRVANTFARHEDEAGLARGAE